MRRGKRDEQGKLVCPKCDCPLDSVKAKGQVYYYCPCSHSDKEAYNEKGEVIGTVGQ